ncbi:MAG: winged helix-turn-helix transcriptional regulator [Chloroflexaceae bacterium]|nr:winged helix-turn-helix transcriptional regulator [Chloroflexaceae bacterium]
MAEKYQVGIIGTWHFNKSGKRDALELVSGSIGLPAVSVNRIAIIREPDQAEARLISNSKRGPTADWTLQFDSVTGQWVKLGDTRQYKLSAERRQIVDFLAERTDPASVREIADALELRYNNVVQLLRSMRQDGQIESPRRGEYILTIMIHDRNLRDSVSDTPDHDDHEIMKGGASGCLPEPNGLALHDRPNHESIMNGPADHETPFLHHVQRITEIMKRPIGKHARGPVGATEYVLTRTPPEMQHDLLNWIEENKRDISSR